MPPKKYTKPPVKGGVRRRNVNNMTINNSGDSSLIRYSSLGDLQQTLDGIASTDRYYIPGFSRGLTSSRGTTVVSAYATSLFRPGTTIRWEPSCSFTTSGRVFVAWTDSPEVMAKWNTGNDVTRLALVQGSGTVRSFPVWQETDIPFPTNTRRKRFDTNEVIVDLSDVNVLDRSSQQLMMAVITADDGFVGQFNFHDVVHVENMIPPSAT